MITSIVMAFSLAFLSSLLLTVVVRTLALKLKLVDEPGGHKQHSQVTPALGGVSVYLALMLAVYHVCPLTSKLMALLSSATLVALTGALDDVRRVPATQKLAMLGLASTLLCLGGWPTGLGLTLGLNWLASFLWVGLVSSAFNGIDNADGAAGGLAVISAFVCGLLACWAGKWPVALVCVALVGALLGFLVFNFPRPKASIFLGDSGSLLIGLLLSCLALEAAPVGGFSGLVFASLLLALPLFDFLLILILRGLKGQYRHWREPITMCARDHVFHRLHCWGWSGQKAVLLMYAGALAVALVAVLGWGLLGVPGIHLATVVALVAALSCAATLNQAPLPEDVYAAHRSTR